MTLIMTKTSLMSDYVRRPRAAWIATENARLKKIDQLRRGKVAKSQERTEILQKFKMQCTNYVIMIICYFLTFFVGKTFSLNIFKRLRPISIFSENVFAACRQPSWPNGCRFLKNSKSGGSAMMGCPFRYFMTIVLGLLRATQSSFFPDLSPIYTGFK